MSDGLIRCGNGCGRTLSWTRLTEGARGPSGIACEHCVAERILGDCGDAIGLLTGEREAFVQKYLHRMFASGIEAGTATTEGRGAEPESPTPVGETPHPKAAGIPVREIG